MQAVFDIYIKSTKLRDDLWRWCSFHWVCSQTEDYGWCYCDCLWSISHGRHFQRECLSCELHAFLGNDNISVFWNLLFTGFSECLFTYKKHKFDQKDHSRLSWRWHKSVLITQILFSFDVKLWNTQIIYIMLVFL